MVSMLCLSPRDAKLEPIILVVLRGAVFPPAELRGFALCVIFPLDACAFGFVRAVFDFAVFALDTTLRERLEELLFDVLRAAAFLPELILFFLVFFLVAILQV
jgi:hypothetical protein